MIGVRKAWRATAGWVVLGLSATQIQANAQIVNGSFETGDLTGFSHLGFKNIGGANDGRPTYQTYLAEKSKVHVGQNTDSNAVVASQTTAFDGLGITGPAGLPSQGNFLAFVSNETGAGDSTLSGSEISQTFTVTPGFSQFRFDLRLLSNDFGGFNGSDFGGIAILQGGSVIRQFNIDLNDPANVSPTIIADAHITPDAALGGFNSSTPWLSPVFDLRPQAGNQVTFVAYTMNYADNSTETRLLVDNLQLAPDPTPEPGAFALMGAAASAGFCLYRRRTRERP